jgi:hypothetical protein
MFLFTIFYLVKLNIAKKEILILSIQGYINQLNIGAALLAQAYSKNIRTIIE